MYPCFKGYIENEYSSLVIVISYETTDYTLAFNHEFYCLHPLVLDV